MATRILLILILIVSLIGVTFWCYFVVTSSDKLTYTNSYQNLTLSCIASEVDWAQAKQPSRDEINQFSKTCLSILQQ